MYGHKWFKSLPDTKLGIHDLTRDQTLIAFETISDMCQKLKKWKLLLLFDLSYVVDKTNFRLKCVAECFRSYPAYQSWIEVVESSKMAQATQKSREVSAQRFDWSNSRLVCHCILRESIAARFANQCWAGPFREVIRKVHHCFSEKFCFFSVKCNCQANCKLSLGAFLLWLRNDRSDIILMNEKRCELNINVHVLRSEPIKGSGRKSAKSLATAEKVFLRPWSFVFTYRQLECTKMYTCMFIASFVVFFHAMCNRQNTWFTHSGDNLKSCLRSQQLNWTSSDWLTHQWMKSLNSRQQEGCGFDKHWLNHKKTVEGTKLVIMNSSENT